jgi:hypothetical protein
VLRDALRRAGRIKGDAKSSRTHND